MKKYNNPPEKSDFEYFQNFSDFQIVVLCEFELLRKNKKFTKISYRKIWIIQLFFLY